MKRMTALAAAVLLSVVLLYAQDTGKQTEMVGWICNSKCVKQVDGKATCDPNCKEKDGDAVFIDDQGKVTKIATQEICKTHLGQKVKVKCKLTKDKDKETKMEIYDVTNLGSG